MHRNGDTDQFEMWLNAVEDPNIKDEFGRTPLPLSGINSKSSYCPSSYPISNDFLNLDLQNSTAFPKNYVDMNIIEYIIEQSTCSTLHVDAHRTV